MTTKLSSRNKFNHNKNTLQNHYDKEEESQGNENKRTSEFPIKPVSNIKRLVSFKIYKANLASQKRLNNSCDQTTVKPIINIEKIIECENYWENVKKQLPSPKTQSKYNERKQFYLTQKFQKNRDLKNTLKSNFNTIKYNNNNNNNNNNNYNLNSQEEYDEIKNQNKAKIRPNSVDGRISIQMNQDKVAFELSKFNHILNAKQNDYQKQENLNNYSENKNKKQKELNSSIKNTITKNEISTTKKDKSWEIKEDSISMFLEFPISNHIKFGTVPKEMDANHKYIHYSNHSLSNLSINQKDCIILKNVSRQLWQKAKGMNILEKILKQIFYIKMKMKRVKRKILV